MTYKRKTACVHLYMHPDEHQRFNPNIYVDGESLDLQALLITAARINDQFHDAFLEAADWLRRDEAIN